MASDRGTLQRGGDQQAPWVGPTAPTGRRLPSAPRERKPALAVLVVLLIVGGALAAGLLVVRSGQRVSAIEVTAEITKGEQIPVTDMREVMLNSDSGLTVSPVGWQFVNEVSNWYASTTLAPGTVLDQYMLSKTNPLVTSQATDVGLALKDGQLPGNLAVGDTIDIFSTQASSTGCPGKAGAALTIGATVLAVTPSTAGTDTTDVEIQMNATFPTVVGALVCNTSNGTAAVAIAPSPGGG